ncbi:nuclear transport factor 2 family protein [Streptomyces niveus]|uniref:nuclear transport factor 2 family protein n=1 Tax=Streptomyces niveus TaxID=193462 RepID=UPI00369E2D44
MSEFQVIADRVEIEALRGEYTDAAMVGDRDRLVSLFTDDAVYRIPDAAVALTGRDEIRAGTERLAGVWEYFVQTTHPGTIRLDGDTASGRAYVSELGRLRDGTSMVNHGLFHDHYRRTPDGWKFTERLFEVRYYDSTPLPGSPHVVRPATNRPGDTMTTHIPATAHTDPASDEQLKRAASALTAHGFTAEVLDDVAAARARVEALIPEGAGVFTAASETLRLSGIQDDINSSGRYQAVKPRVLAMDRATAADDIRRLLASPDVVVGSVAALTETGSLVVASGSGSQLPSYAGGAGLAIWIVGAQKVVPDLHTALRRVEDHALPLENARAQEVYGQPSAVNRLLVLNAEPHPGRGVVLLLREAIGF